MANFKTHITVASAVSGAAAACLLEAGAIGRDQVLLCTALGALGGTLPDVDSDHSTPAQLLYGFFAALAAFLAMFSQVQRLSVLELLLVWALVFVAVRHGLLRLVERLTVHRGLFHSLPAALLCGFATAALGHRLFGAAPALAWTAGAFVALGYAVHLTLDELYSVDLTGVRIKRSFGTALKLFSREQPLWSLALVAATAAAYLAAPPPDEFLRVYADPQTWSAMARKLLPQAGWLGLR